MSRHDNAITTREFWDSHAATAALSPDEPPVPADLFRRYLPASTRPGRRALEIGAYPGRFLYYAAANYGYEPFALDYCKAAKALSSMFEAARAPKAHPSMRTFCNGAPVSGSTSSTRSGSSSTSTTGGDDPPSRGARRGRRVPVPDDAIFPEAPVRAALAPGHPESQAAQHSRHR